MAIQANEDRAEEKVEGYKQQLTAEPALEPVSDFVDVLLDIESSSLWELLGFEVFVIRGRLIKDYFLKLSLLSVITSCL